MNISLNVAIFCMDTVERKNIKRLPQKKMQILLCKNNNKLMLPTFNFIETQNIKTTVLECINQILKKDNLYIEQLYTWGEPEYYQQNNQLSISYLVIVDKSKIQLINKNYKWYNIGFEDINSTEKYKSQKFYLETDEEKYEYIMDTEIKNIDESLEYLHYFHNDCPLEYNHSIILITALKRLKSRIEYTEIAFKFLPKEFLLTELQQVYECILGKEMDKGNFRKKIISMVEKTDFIKKDGGFRPAAYYKLNSEYLKHWI